MLVPSDTKYKSYWGYATTKNIYLILLWVLIEELYLKCHMSYFRLDKTPLNSNYDKKIWGEIKVVEKFREQKKKIIIK